MRCERFRDAVPFLEAATPCLVRHEAENTVLLGMALALRARPAGKTLMLTLGDGRGVRLAALMTPPENLLLSAGDPGALGPLADDLRGRGPWPPGVGGPGAMAGRFAACWAEGCGAEVEAEHRMVLYRLDARARGGGAPGALRPASSDEVERIAGWFVGAVAEMGLNPAEAAEARERMAEKIARREVFCWEVGGRPVSMVTLVPTAPTGDAGRIQAVYTPDAERGRGYASAAVAALSDRLLGGGWRYVLIYADAGNPATNRMYERIGYRRIGTFDTFAFRYP